MLRNSILALAVSLTVVGCGSSSSSPEDAVRSFTKAYAAGDVEKACSYYDQQGEGRMTQALADAAGESNGAIAEMTKALSAVKDRDGICPANLGLIRRWDPDPGRATKLTVKDTDSDKEQASVETSAGTWKLHEVDGQWKLSNVDPVIPADLAPR